VVRLVAEVVLFRLKSREVLFEDYGFVSSYVNFIRYKTWKSGLARLFSTDRL
jgi:hypothetical protein